MAIIACGAPARRSRPGARVRYAHPVLLRTLGWRCARRPGTCPRTPGILRFGPIAWQPAGRPAAFVVTPQGVSFHGLARALRTNSQVQSRSGQGPVSAATVSTIMLLAQSDKCRTRGRTEQSLTACLTRAYITYQSPTKVPALPGFHLTDNMAICMILQQLNSRR
jgi:hypothetical protein